MIRFIPSFASEVTNLQLFPFCDVQHRIVKFTMKCAIVKAGLVLFRLHLAGAFLSGPHWAALTSNLVSTSTKSVSPLARMTTTTASREGTVIDLLDANFADLFNSKTPLLVDAYSTWCGPCKLIEPIIANCAKERTGSLVVSRWNVESPQIDVKIELLLQGANPSKLPSLILVHAGSAKIIHEGLITQDQLNDLLQATLPEMTRRTGHQSAPKASNEGDLRNKKESGNSKRQAGFVSFVSQESDDYMMGAMFRP